MSKPLEGIRVVELGQLLAGPFTGAILGYFGAEVIKVVMVNDQHRFDGAKKLLYEVGPHKVIVEMKTTHREPFLQFYLNFPLTPAKAGFFLKARI